MRALLIYPHQLFRDQTVIRDVEVVVLAEDPLFFSQYPFHAQKLVLHRASMKQFASELEAKGKQVHYIDAKDLPETGSVVKALKRLKVKAVCYFDPVDDWLEQRLFEALQANRMSGQRLPHPHFLTSPDQFKESTKGRKKLFFTDFYIQQRRRLGLLLDDDGMPLGGKWSFDTENRKKLPKNQAVPQITTPKATPAVQEAIEYVATNFPRSFGLQQILSGSTGGQMAFRYPITVKDAKLGLKEFLDHRLGCFGLYEDAIDDQHDVLFHSLLTPALNIGLLSPEQVVQATLERLDDAPLNSVEGFIRQVIGWREFMLGVYRSLGRKQRCGNYWGHMHTMPSAFYDGSTGIVPVDTVIHRTLRTAYCHHIERLMILGNFMLLCQIHPQAIYQWFMELFIDAYDWVMVPNVYGMSQYADGGLITTKPYISGSSYVLKMSNFKRGDWCEIWDGLYWRFIHQHRDFFSKNPRMSVMVRQCEKMGSKLDKHLQVAQHYLTELHRL